ncbi:MAG: hypothetical protein NT023_04175 [Armatimonadetes bacterium]|nr:hypothetical protein [Armatimonadota bacterium]
MNNTFDCNAEDARKSNLLLQAALLREQGQYDRAASLFAEAAAIEERLAESAEAQGDTPHALRHRFSVASGWAQAGDFHHALALLSILEERSDTPPSFRERVQTFTRVLREQRKQWSLALGETRWAPFYGE